jgi:hypothetical protein
MKIMTTMFWIILFTLFVPGDNFQSQSITPSSNDEVIILYSDDEMQLRELCWRIKYSRCQLLLMHNQMAIDKLKDDEVPFFTRLGYPEIDEDSTAKDSRNR